MLYQGKGSTEHAKIPSRQTFQRSGNKCPNQNFLDHLLGKSRIVSQSEDCCACLILGIEFNLVKMSAFLAFLKEHKVLDSWG